jgi:uncharacterized protein with HEPN domain
MRNHDLCFNDILSAVHAIETFVKGMTFEDFCRDD